MASEYDLIVVVGQYKDEKRILGEALKAGAPGVTYFYGRGTGVRQKLGLLGNLIQKEKLILFTAVPSEKSAAILKTLIEKAELNKPGKGFACVLKLNQVMGLL